MHRSRLVLPALTVIAMALFAQAPAGNAAPEMEWREAFSEDGTITMVLTQKVPQERPSDFRMAVAADVVPIQVTGESSERFDLVFVGDGYTADDLATYADNVKSKWAELSAVEPFASYKDYFNVWQVNVISSQSGVDNDPTPGLDRITELDMGFWCRGTSATERLLCVNQDKANAYASLAPQADQVVALGNTAKYGGAGGSVATAAGSNVSSGQIVVHELGHSIGGLADEYDAPGTYTGAEPVEPNVTKDPTGEKWKSYLGQETPDGGVVGVFEGARYFRVGLYRPTSNSIMRTLGKQFNSIGRDAMVKAIKAKVPSLTEPVVPPAN